MLYAELQVTSHFSFLRGASSCEELFAQAAELGIAALAITDRNTLAGVVRAHEAAKIVGIRLVVGCRLDLSCGTSVLVYPMHRTGYGDLCRLLSSGKRLGGKAKCVLGWSDLVEHGAGLIAVLLAEAADAACAFRLRRLAADFPGRGYLALTLYRRAGEAVRLHQCAVLAARAGVPAVVTNDVLFHDSSRRVLQDVVTCIRHNCTIDEAGFRLERNADRILKTPEEMTRLFARYPEAVARTMEIVERCRFSLDELAYQYPDETDGSGLSAQALLERLVGEAAAARYPAGVPEKVATALAHELPLIERLKYASYFLTVNSIVRFARSKDILCQGRGSAANSAVCFVLGITSIDPQQHDLLFERFISEERREPPDIDVDFEHEQREIVIQWIYEHYGRDRAAICATVIRYRARGAVRDVGKVLGLSEDLIKQLNSQAWWWSADGIEPEHVEELNLNIEDRRLRMTIELARELIGTPRHLSQHTGGFVLTRDRLDELVPIEPAAMEKRQVIEWDKDDIEALRFMKVDVLALGMLSCLKRAFEFLKEYEGAPRALEDIPPDDAATYRMISKADTIGTFQIESRAQMSMLPRMKPQKLFDLVIQVAIVRPGPIQGDMVIPYLRRREGKEPVSYPKPEFEKVLGETLGVPLFQEQAMRVAIECAGFTASEADQLRRSMATFKMTGGVGGFRGKLVEGMVARGYEREFAERMFRQLEGFGSYGFPQSHAASFALLAYASSWIKCHYPAVFCAALLNAQPMGFYAPAQIVRDAREHGVEVRPVCVNASRWDCTLEGDAVRLGLRMVKGLGNAQAAKLVAARGDGAFGSVQEVWRRAGVPGGVLARLAEADGFRESLGLARREALWATKGLRDEVLPLFAGAAEAEEPEVRLAPMADGGEVVEDYRRTGLSLRAHPVSFLREELSFGTCAAVGRAVDGAQVTVAGVVLVRQRPGSAKGVIFITIEDETGIANLVVWPALYERQRRVVLGARLMGVAGQVQREGEVVHLVARHVEDLSGRLADIGVRSRDFH